MKKVIILALVAITTVLFSQDIKSVNEYSKLMGFKFQVPKGYKEIKLPEQEDTLVNIAFKKDDNVEYRIGLYPYSDLPDQLKNAKNSDELYSMLNLMTYTICLNISQDEDRKLKIKKFDEAEVKKEFGADAGLYDTVRGNSDFSKGYTFVNINSLYKKNKGLIVIYVLIKDFDEYLKTGMNEDNLAAYYAIKFK